MANKQWRKPEIRVCKYDPEDIVTTSPATTNKVTYDVFTDNEWWDYNVPTGN